MQIQTYKQIPVVRKLEVLVENEVKIVEEIIEKLGIRVLRWLLEFYRRNGVLLKRIAQEADVSEATIYHIKSGILTNPTVDKIKKIMKACYNISPSLSKAYLQWFFQEFKRELEDFLGQKLT